MKLYSFHGTDDNGDSVDQYVVAEDPAQAAAVYVDHIQRDASGADPSDDLEELAGLVDFPSRAEILKSVSHVHVVLEDVSGTAYAGAARAVPWNDIAYIDLSEIK